MSDRIQHINSRQMELKDFIRQYLLYSRLSISELTTKASFEFAMAFLNDPECRSWYIRQRFKDLNRDARELCCIEFAAWHLEDVTQKAQQKERPSAEKFVLYWEDFKSFGIQHSSQQFFVPINYCPWCGKRLPEFDYYTQYHKE
ncbi:MAG: hypothetical protein JNM21_17180 [Taibaiella sp.]|nr:hypothetical protein [Taibaiella sp.]